jgi:peptidoglycan/xylan/chitin deacetylase (PgdA/CDA1 family)
MSAKLSPEMLIPISFESDAGVKHVQLNDVQRVPGHPEYLQWNVTNNATDTDVWAAPVASFYTQTPTPPYYANDGVAVGSYEMNATGVQVVPQHAGYGWVNVPANTSVTVYSEAVVPPEAQWALYNAQLYNNGTSHGWLYPSWDKYAVVGETSGKPKKYVIFRDDDVEPWYALATLKNVNQLHTDKNVPVTLSIIPHPDPSRSGDELLGDAPFLNYLKSLSTNTLFEFAQHGYTHKDVTGTAYKSEFYGVPYAKQYTLIKSGQTDIQSAFNITPTTFVPPFDRSDDNTLLATKALGFTEYSTAASDFGIVHGYQDGMRIDVVSIVLDDVGTLQSLKDKTNRLLSDTHTDDPIIVLYHYWSLSGASGTTNAFKLKLLSDYMDYLKNRGDVTFTNFNHSYEVGG